MGLLWVIFDRAADSRTRSKSFRAFKIMLLFGTDDGFQMTNLRAILELAYFVSGVLTAGAALFALQQLRLLKFDIKMRIERAAKEKAIEYGSRYLSNYVMLAKYQVDQTKIFPQYCGPAPDQHSSFCRKSLDKHGLGNAWKRWDDERWLPALNELQAIASSFVSGVADEEVGFGIFGRSFVRAVETHYDLLCLANDGKPNGYFSSIIALYKSWRPRLTTEELRAAKEGIEAALERNTSGVEFPPIGKREASGS